MIKLTSRSGDICTFGGEIFLHTVQRNREVQEYYIYVFNTSLSCQKKREKTRKQEKKQRYGLLCVSLVMMLYPAVLPADVP